MGDSSYINESIILKSQKCSLKVGFLGNFSGVTDTYSKNLTSVV